MAEPTPKPTVRPTGWRAVLAAGLIGAAAGWLLLAVPDRLGAPLPALPLVVTITVVVVAGASWLLAWRTHRRVQVRREPIETDRAIALLAYAKASVLAGALLAGGYLAIGLYSLQRLSAQLPRERLISSVVAVLASVGWVAGGAMLERACKIPDPPADDATPRGLPGSPRRGD